MIKVFLVDDRAAVRRGLRLVQQLESDLTVVGDASRGTAALELVPTPSPDVVVMDVEMPGMDGVAATTALRTIAPRSTVVVLTLYDDAAPRSRVQAAGARAFVSKHDAAGSLPPAIRFAAGWTAA